MANTQTEWRNEMTTETTYYVYGNEDQVARLRRLFDSIELLAANPGNRAAAAIYLAASAATEEEAA
jgi:hypothetical protein